MNHSEKTVSTVEQLAEQVRNLAARVENLSGRLVFVHDMFGVKGMPLVVSVFSTGLVAAFGSLVMGQWQKKKGGDRLTGPPLCIDRGGCEK
jgi:hypothetical protein